MTKRVLLIDDEEHIRRMMRLTLEAAGYQAGEAKDGAEGIRIFGDGSTWDAVVLDQRMPGMDGLDVLRQIKSVDPMACVVMATAYASIELAVDAMKLGASDFVRKPMTPETLRNAISASLTKNRGHLPYYSAGSAELPSTPQIQTLTMNGFSIIDGEKEKLPGQERCFVVISPNGAREDVVVEISQDVIEYVARITHRRLAPTSSFWTEEARRLLADYLWNESNITDAKRLILKDVSRDKLLLAERWQDD